MGLEFCAPSQVALGVPLRRVTLRTVVVLEGGRALGL